MRIIEAFKHHFNKNLLIYGIISLVIGTLLCAASPEVFIFFLNVFEKIGEAYALLVASGLTILYGLVIIAVLFPFIKLVRWCKE